MLIVNDLAKRFGDTLLFEHVSFVINAGERIGFVGPNGAGKSTLLRLITGEELRDGGSVRLAPGVSLGYLRQGFSDLPNGTLRDVLDIPTGGIFHAADALEQSADDLAKPDIDPVVAASTYDAALAHFDALGGYDLQDDVHAMLDRFHMGDIQLDRPLASLSGGQKTRAGLAALLATRPDVLLLDEPTNHLDAEGLDWLTHFLKGYDGAVLVVSHDRAFLDDVVTHILELDDRRRTTRVHVGSYSDYVSVRHHEEQEAEEAWKRQNVEIERINRDIRAMESKARTIENSTIDFAVRKKAAKIVRPAVVRKRKLERLLDSEDAAEKPERRWGLTLAFNDPSGGARDVAVLEDVSVAFGDRQILRSVDLHVRHGERLAVTGANGSGKTTLLRLITGDLVPTTGRAHLGANVRPGYFSQEQRTLDLGLTVLEHARRVAAMSESDIRTELHKFLFAGDTVHRLVGDLSYGERARLMLALLVFQQTNLLLLDEPLNHLDIQARESFEQALQAFEGTLIMVLHDRYSIQLLSTRAVHIEDGLVREIPIPEVNDDDA